MRVKEGMADRGESIDEASIAEQLPEQEVGVPLFIPNRDMVESYILS